MVSTKVVAKTIPEIETALKSFFGDMVKIEYLENCLRQMVPNDVSRFCNIKLGELYAGRSMYGPASKHLDEAADRTMINTDKVTLYLKEMVYLIKEGDYLLIDRAFKKALECANASGKDRIKEFFKKELFNKAAEYEKKGRNSNAVKIYEKLAGMQIINENERKFIITKLGSLCSKIGRIKDSFKYEDQAKRPMQPIEPDVPKKLSISDLDLGIEFV